MGPSRSPVPASRVAGDRPSPQRHDAIDLQIREGEAPVDFFGRVAPLVAQVQVTQAVAGNDKAGRWLLEQSGAVQDRLSTPLEISHEELDSAEGVSRTMRRLTTMALRGDLGLTEARRASDLVKESAESVFANEISSLKDAIERARRNSRFSVKAIVAESMSRSAVDAEEVDGGDPLLIEEMTAVPASRLIEGEPVREEAPSGPPKVQAPAWGRFGRT